MLMRTARSSAASSVDPLAQNALNRIILELALIKHEEPTSPPRQQLQEARRRSAEAMVAAADAIEARGLTSCGRMNYI
jgi:hypothetical protein